MTKEELKMFELATETGRNLAEAAEKAAKAMQEFADLLREAEKESDSNEFWKYRLEHLAEMREASKML